MHAAKPDSQRLTRLMDLLRQRGDAGVTTLEINHLCDSTRASSDVSELRHATGAIVECRYIGQTGNGRRLHSYRLAPNDDILQRGEKTP